MCSSQDANQATPRYTSEDLPDEPARSDKERVFVAIHTQKMCFPLSCLSRLLHQMVFIMEANIR
jgi:hypothetical protein